LITWCGYLGAAALAVAPFTIDTPEGKLMAIAGLALLTLQSLDLKAYNLTFLNLAGIAGYSFSYFGA
jgi:hypothetical protein